MDDLKQLFVRLRSATTGETFAPAELRARIVADVEERESNLNDVVCEILARKYKVEFAPRGRRAHPKAGDEVLALRLPSELLRAIDTAAVSVDRNRQDETLATLCEHYGLEFEAARKRNGPNRLRADAVAA